MVSVLQSRRDCKSQNRHFYFSPSFGQAAQCGNNNSIRLQAYQGATPLDLYATAQRAASLADTHARIQTTTRHLSHPLWQQSRTWDPDD